MTKAALVTWGYQDGVLSHRAGMDTLQRAAKPIWDKAESYVQTKLRCHCHSFGGYEASLIQVDWTWLSLSITSRGGAVPPSSYQSGLNGTHFLCGIELYG